MISGATTAARSFCKKAIPAPTGILEPSHFRGLWAVSGFGALSEAVAGRVWTLLNLAAFVGAAWWIVDRLPGGLKPLSPTGRYAVFFLRSGKPGVLQHPGRQYRNSSACSGLRGAQVAGVWTRIWRAVARWISLGFGDAFQSSHRSPGRGVWVDVAPTSG